MDLTIKIDDSYVAALAAKYYQHDPNKEPLDVKQQQQKIVDEFVGKLKADLSTVILSAPDVQLKDQEILDKQTEKDLLVQQKTNAAIAVDAAAIAADAFIKG